MVTRPVCILGGLPAWATINYSYDSYTGESDSEVEELFWQKRDGSRGSALPQHIFDKALSYGNDYQGCDIIEQVDATLGYEQWEREEMLHAAQVYQRGWLPERYLIHHSPWGF